jgi:nucleotide-binding universal stress UspA family protein
MAYPGLLQHSTQSAAFATEWEVGQTPGTASGRLSAPLIAVVGFDGSEPAKRALDSAARLVHDRDGHLEVVYVAHAPASAALTPMAMAEIASAFDDLERRLGHEVSNRLASTEPRWHFRRRDGAVAHELIAVGDELRRQNGPQTTIVLIVGGSSHKSHRLLGSVSSKLERVDRFPVVVVP